MKSRSEFYTEIMEMVRFRDMSQIRAEMSKRYRGVVLVHALTMEQLEDWSKHLQGMISRGELTRASGLPAKSSR